MRPRPVLGPRDVAWPEPADPRDPFVDLPGDASRWITDPAPVPERLPTLAELARVATDIAPGLGNEAPDRVLGPWVDELDPHVPAERRALLVALAASAFVPPDDDTRTPFFQWSRREPPPSAADRESFRALERAPWAAWCLRAITPEGVVLDDLVGLPARRRPDAPVLADLVGALVPATPGDTLLARVVRARSGWEAATPLVVRGRPPEALLQRWLAARPPRASVEAWLSGSGHAFVRRVCEWAWAQRSRAG